jgi:hypothetical protein
MWNQPQPKQVEPAPRESVFGLALSRDLANDIFNRVKTSGLSIHDVSTLIPDDDATGDGAREKSMRINRRGRQRAAWWTARWNGFASIGALAIPGAGLFVAAGPIIFALSGAIAGGAGGGGLSGALVGMGISESEAGRYESKIKEGNILISVHTGNPADITLAKAIFREAGAQCICTTDEAPLKDSPVTERASGSTEAVSSPFKADWGNALP